MQLALDGRPIDKLVIDDLREFVTKEGYQVAYSGGKDSDTLLDLVKRSGVDFVARYSFCALDPPELRQHIKAMRCDPANRLTFSFPARSLLTIAKERGIMPLRRLRWCCEVLKERPSKTGRTILTGIRWAESARRKKRRRIESCNRTRAFFFHPIINWKTSDVWNYIHERNVPYCCLYDEGWKRLGCVLCPMVRDVEKQMARWPGQVRIWRKINDAVWHTRHVRHMAADFDTPEKQWLWWLNRDTKLEEEDCPLFDGVLE